MVRNYDPAEVLIAIGGVPMQGFADGTFITVERSNDAFTKVTGADGKTSRAKSNDRSGTVTLTLLQTSPSNDQLSAFALLDEASSQGVVPIMIKDNFGTSLAFTESAWVRKVPNTENSKEIGTREWVFDCSDLDLFTGGNNEAVPA